ncbi:MAG TPA: bifunctional hydroxymethylpyrimidine kinase/phosphomethylpyrimidine kinase [Acidimicrobiales bacterium]|nr:bifunctional hydroxymethylpyrimidine kinase/phosphomethylpyrimidine kinase [Acidimicrobiales bacterium]
MNPPVALTVAGSDSAGGAGLQADLRTFAALGVFGTSVVTAVTAQNTQSVLGIERIDPPFVDLQLEAVLGDLPVAAVKTGMLASSATIVALSRWASAHRLPNLVVDPVLVASTGKPLLDAAAVDSYRESLFPHAAAITPNLHEAALLTGMAIGDVDDMATAARLLGDTGATMVVVKGGHLGGKTAPDVVVTGGKLTVLEARRVVTTNDHGTGCTLSAALAARLAIGDSLLEAMATAKRYVGDALAGAAAWRLGRGHGPLDHFGWGARAVR